MVDDQIPCDSISGRPLFAQNADPNEIWVCLLEKAMAKLWRGYGALAQGMSESEALKYMIGGVSRNTKLEELSVNGLWDRCTAVAGEGGLLGLADVGQEWQEGGLPAKWCGITPNHAYALLQISVGADGNRYFLLRNPWGSLTRDGAQSEAAALPVAAESVFADVWDPRDGGMFVLTEAEVAAAFTTIYEVWLKVLL